MGDIKVHKNLTPTMKSYFMKNRSADKERLDHIKVYIVDEKSDKTKETRERWIFMKERGIE